MPASAVAPDSLFADAETLHVSLTRFIDHDGRHYFSDEYNVGRCIYNVCTKPLTENKGHEKRCVQNEGRVGMLKIKNRTCATVKGVRSR